MKPSIQRLLPATGWNLLRNAGCSVADLLDLLSGQQGALTPPRRLISHSLSEFRQTGEEFLGHFKSIASLQPWERILDIGCGVGRMAIPLTRYLDGNGSYDGLDIVSSWIRWCTDNISGHHPNFRFHLAPIYNAHYNPSGTVSASEYRFCFQDASFDFVFLTSVFTHLRPREMEHYLSEIARVLRSEGRCLMTFFLLNPESWRLIKRGRSSQPFQHQLEGFWTTDRNIPETAVAYEESFIRNVLSKSGLSIVAPVRYGSWCGRVEFLSYQDLVLVTNSKGSKPCP